MSELSYRAEIKEWRRISTIYEKALRQIIELGHVCSEFETCTHQSCSDSHRAWEIASQALEEADPPQPRAPTEPEETREEW